MGQYYSRGLQSRLAEHFRVSRARVNQIVKQERQRIIDAGEAIPDPDSKEYQKMIRAWTLSLEHDLEPRTTESHFGEDLYRLRRAYRMGPKNMGFVMGIPPGAVSYAETNFSTLRWRPKKAAGIIASAQKNDPEIAGWLIKLFQKWGYDQQMWEEQFGIKVSEPQTLPATT